MFVNTNEKGAIAEMAIALEAVRHGIGVLKPLSERQRYDLGLEVGGRLMRAQCKWGRLENEVIKMRLGTSRYTPRGYVRTRYTIDDVDAFAVYCEPLASCYLIPLSEVGTKTCLHLRVGEVRNGQRAGLNFAADYEFGAVAQLGERPAGSREVRGSSPLSSTSLEPAAVEATTVGAHEFRNRFGWYMERAAAGEEIRVSRRGRPYVRLLTA